MSLPAYVTAYALSQRNRQSVLASERCGCFHCLATFSPDEIRSWDEDAATAHDATAHDATALCPYCGAEAVLGSAAGYALTHDFLLDMQRQWFGAGRSPTG